MSKIGDNVRVPLGLGIVIDIRNVVGTKHQTNRWWYIIGSFRSKC